MALIDSKQLNPRITGSFIVSSSLSVSGSFTTSGSVSMVGPFDLTGNMNVVGNISGSATATGSFGMVDVATEVLTPLLTFDSHTYTGRNINVKSGSISISVTENFSVGVDNTINIEDNGRLLLVPPSFFIT